MIKRSAPFLVLAISINACLSAQNCDLKYYSAISDCDYENDYGGVAVALYLTESEAKCVDRAKRATIPF